MKENETIIVNGIPAADYDNLILECVKYSIISLPFTVDRIKIDNETRRVLNIAKGKIAEALFRYFCVKNNIFPDFKSCATPFWTTDRRDFILNRDEWDIKNNFIYHPGRLLPNSNYSDLPALVPNRYDGDQWSKRVSREFPETSSVHFLFTFLQNAEPMDNKNRGKEFLEITLSEGQRQFLRELYGRYKGRPQPSRPFAENGFWTEMRERGNLSLYQLHFKPPLIITSYANSSHWPMFKDTGKSDPNNNFHSYLNPGWYDMYDTGALSFMSGTLWTKITNATCPVSLLPSFLSLYPHLRNKINCAEIKSEGIS